MATRRSTRKRGRTLDKSAEDEEPAAKVPTRASRKRGVKQAVAPAGVVWEWEGDGGWTAYDTNLGKKITEAFLQKENQLVLQISPRVKMKLDFLKMTQSNVATGWQRNIKCAADQSDPSSSGKWEWQDEDGGWNVYPPAVQRLLGACVLCDVDQWKIEVAGRQYKVDVGVKVQTNVETGVQRTMRCTHQGADIPGGGGGVADIPGGGGVADIPGGGGVAGTRSRKRGRKREGSSDTTAAKGEGSTAMKEEGSIAAKGEGPVEDTDQQEDTDSRVLVTYRGKVPVDYECSQKVGKAHVFCEEVEHWDATLNQTNLKNNNNKFYILQLLKDNGSNTYSVWFRWGRVGKAGQHSLTNCGGDLDQAKNMFTKKFREKTCNSWDERESFVKHAGKYDLLSMDYNTKEETDGDNTEEVDGGVATDTPPEPVQSKLDQRLQTLIELICDVRAMEEAVIEMKYDAKKAPLGKLTADQVRSGYAALKVIEECINRNDFGDRLVQACDQFYTRVPHSFGMQRPPIIRTSQQVKEKIALLETLSDIQIALKVLSGGDKQESLIDRHYQGLHCTLNPLDHEDKEFVLVEKYVRQTHAKTHSQYNLQVEEVFQVERQGEREAFKDVGNRQLLWHGSRLSNWVGILSQGLRVAPPEAPVTGYMFGKGVYFADMCSKSANYCFASRAKSDGLALLCDVSLGHTQDLLGHDYNADQLPKGKNSTRGLGKLAPDPTQSHTLADGCVVPLGTPIDTGAHNPSGYTLNYNEFIVYDPKQIRMKYLVKLKFHFN